MRISSRPVIEDPLLGEDAGRFVYVDGKMIRNRRRALHDRRIRDRAWRSHVDYESTFETGRRAAMRHAGTLPPMDDYAVDVPDLDEIPF